MSNESSEPYVDRVLKSTKEVVAGEVGENKLMAPAVFKNKVLYSAMRSATTNGIQWARKHGANTALGQGPAPVDDINKGSAEIDRVFMEYRKLHEQHEKLADIWRTEGVAAWKGHGRRLLFTFFHGIAVASILLGTYAVAHCWGIPMPMMRLP